MSNTRSATSTFTLLGVLVLPAVLLALSGCTGSTPSQVLPSEGSKPSQPAEPGTPDTVITMSLQFMPQDITVAAGTTVTWQNGETISHTITSGAWGDVNESTGLRGSQTPDGLFDHALAPKGESGDSFSFTFDEPGTYLYYCQPHLTMNAMVLVE